MCDIIRHIKKHKLNKMEILLIMKGYNMISKKDFIERMNAIETLHEDQSLLFEALESITEGYFIVTLGDKLADTILKQTNAELHPQDMDLLAWWLYEDVEHLLWIDDKEVNVEKLEDLYDFMISVKK